MRETWIHFLGWEDPLEESNGDPLQYPCLENAMDRGAWQALVNGVTETGLSDKSMVCGPLTGVCSRGCSWSL